MLKIGITQRIDYIEAIDETRDVLDQRWTKLFEKNDFILVPIPNTCNVPNFINTMGLDGILISGGNDHETRTICETACIEYCIKHKLPLFGICHGMQFIGQYWGANLIKIENHVATDHSVIITDNPYHISAGEILVNSYHNFTLDKVPQDFISFAHDNKGNCEAMYHKNLPIITFMWHPERPPFLSWFNRFIKDFYEKH